jgi:hypothetical protein
MVVCLMYRYRGLALLGRSYRLNIYSPTAPRLEEGDLLQSLLTSALKPD